MSDKPLVTVITTAYKGADNFLEELIHSVEIQTYPNIEHIVVDDGSPDDGRTIEILKKYPHIRWWTRPNKGQYPSLNEGLRAATGVWLTINAQDDRFHDEFAIEKIMDYALAHPDVDVVHGDTFQVDHEGKALPLQRRQKYPYWALQYELFISHCSLFVKTSEVLGKELFFDESYKYVGDADWICRLQLAGLRFGHVKRYVFDYRHHQNQATTNANINAAAGAAREAERARFFSIYRPNRFLRKLMQTWADFDRRKRILAVYLRGCRKVNGEWVFPS